MERCVQYMIACCCLLTIVSCGSNHHSQPHALLTADSLITDHPDSALLLLAEIAAETETWPREDRMQYYLLRNRAEEKCHILHDNDSAMQEAVRYFDKHGSSQERALAWFELGRVYDEMLTSTSTAHLKRGRLPGFNWGASMTRCNSRGTP